MHDAHIPALKGHNIYSLGQRPMEIMTKKGRTICPPFPVMII